MITSSQLLSTQVTNTTIKATHGRKSVWAHSSKGSQSMMAELRHGGQSRELQAHILNHKHKAQKAPPSDRLLPIRPHLLKLPKQCHQLGTKHQMPRLQWTSHLNYHTHKYLKSKRQDEAKHQHSEKTESSVPGSAAAASLTVWDSADVSFKENPDLQAQAVAQCSEPGVIPTRVGRAVIVPLDFRLVMQFLLFIVENTELVN